METLSKPYILFLFTLAFTACEKPCDLSLRVGEIVEIPVEFNGFTLTEIDKTVVYRIDGTDSALIDTFFLNELLWANTARSTSETLTDNAPAKVQKEYGYYESYLDNCDLILDWGTGKDTLSNFVIKKSQEKITGCHANDPNVKIDHLSFIHKGITVFKNESVQINK